MSKTLKGVAYDHAMPCPALRIVKYLYFVPEKNMLKRVSYKAGEFIGL